LFINISSTADWNCESSSTHDKESATDLRHNQDLGLEEKFQT